MDEIQFRTAKAQLSALVDEAERGHPTTITRHGKPAAVIVPVEHAERMYNKRKSLADVLASYPGGLELVEDDSALPELGL